MRYQRSPKSAKSSRIFQCLVLCALFVFGAWPAWAQVASIVDPTVFKPNTPEMVKNGSATLVGHYDSNKMLRLTLSLKPPHWTEEQQYLQQLQTKGSPEFLHYLSPEEWNKRFSPAVEDEQAIVDWAKSQALTVSRRYPNRLLVDVMATAGAIEQAFHVTINSYQSGTRSFYSNDRDPGLPTSVTNILQGVIGLDNWLVMRPANRHLNEPEIRDFVAGLPESAPVSRHADGNRAALTRAMKAQKAGAVRNITGGAYDPTDIYSSEAYDYNALYNLGHCCNPLGNPGNSPPDSSIAIVTVGSQNFGDIVGFHDNYPYIAWNLTEIGIDGQSVPCTDSTDSTCDGEGTLDMEWTTATANSFGAASNTAAVYLYDAPNFGSFPDAYNAALSAGSARVATTSWSCTENCGGGSFISTLDTIFANMVGQGWTLLAAQGDRGATDNCADAIDVAFPGSDPYVVSAGGTTLSLDSFSNYISEVTWTGGPAGCSSNDGGTGGGCSAVFSAPGYQAFPACGSGSRSVPDLALNADWYHTPQNVYFGGGLGGNGGTSIVAPELAGFFAQENAYLLYISAICGGTCGTIAPVGDPHYELYDEGYNNYSPNFPFYDITSGNNCNDVTSFYGLGCYSAGIGYDAVTGWGSANMLQLAWSINWNHIGPDNYPTVSFSSAYATNTWYNSDPYVSWTIGSIAADGTAGFSQAWDFDPGNPTSAATPGVGNSFYSGPQYPNATSGCLDLLGSFCANGIGGVQGWHTVNIRSWGNEGENAGDFTYGPIGYDTIPPVTTASLSGSLISGTTYKSAVTVTLSASDPGFSSSPQTGSGVSITYYHLNNGGWQVYSGSFAVGYTGSYTVYFFSYDKAGNAETLKSISFKINPAISLSPTGLAFGNEVLGTTSAGKSVTITNIISSSVSLSSIAPSGDFNITGNTCGASLGVGGHCSVTLAFKPSVVGTVSGDLTVAYTGGVGSPDRLGLSGTGLVPLVASPTSLSFGTVTVGSSLVKPLTLKNDNPSTALSISFSANGDYSAAAGGGTPCGASLAGGASCTLNVTFKPHQNGAINGAVSVSDGVSLSPLIVALSGSGTGGVSSPLSFTPSSLSYTNIVVGASTTKTVTVKNVTASSVKISAISHSGDYTASGCITTLTPLATCTLSVTFTPSTTGSIKGAIGLTDNTTVTPEVLDVSGTAILPLTISQSSVNFGGWTVGTTSSATTLTLTNHTAASMNIAFTGSGDFTAVAGGGTPCGASLGAGASCTILVSFSPTTTGTITGVATVTYSGGYSPQEVKLSGTGQ